MLFPLLYDRVYFLLFFNLSRCRRIYSPIEHLLQFKEYIGLYYFLYCRIKCILLSLGLYPSLLFPLLQDRVYPSTSCRIVSLFTISSIQDRVYPSSYVYSALYPLKSQEYILLYSILSICRSVSLFIISFIVGSIVSFYCMLSSQVDKVYSPTQHSLQLQEWLFFTIKFLCCRSVSFKCAIISLIVGVYILHYNIFLNCGSESICSIICLIV